MTASEEELKEVELVGLKIDICLPGAGRASTCLPTHIFAKGVLYKGRTISDWDDGRSEIIKEKLQLTEMTIHKWIGGCQDNMAMGDYPIPINNWVTMN